MTEHLKAISSEPPTKPKAILVVSAHWEEGPELAVLTSPKPPMLYDYFGFPPETYEFKYDAPGDPALASRVQKLLEEGGHPTRPEPARGFDHGVFVPLLLAYPEADIPVIALSLHNSLNAAVHLSIGEKLRPLRDEGVLIIGSGVSFHNMAHFDMVGSKVGTRGHDFDDALNYNVTLDDPKARDAALTNWARLKDARHSHPREEHLLPLMVVAGAAGSDLARRNFAETYMGVRLSGFRFG